MKGFYEIKFTCSYCTTEFTPLKKKKKEKSTLDTPTQSRVTTLFISGVYLWLRNNFSAVQDWQVHV